MWDNLPPGYESFLIAQEEAADAYDYALDKAWEHLADEAPDGVGWEVACDDQDRDAAFIFVFRDAGGYEFETTVNPWGGWDYEPDYYD